MRFWSRSVRLPQEDHEARRADSLVGRRSEHPRREDQIHQVQRQRTDRAPLGHGMHREGDSGEREDERQPDAREDRPERPRKLEAGVS
jgi:hypothetical protein